YHKLIRFDNYRRILVCAKPGRKPQATETQLCYQCQLPLDDQALVSHPHETRTFVQDTKNYFNAPANSSSPYRESKTEENLSERRSDSTRDLEAMTIRNTPIVQQSETEEIVQNTDTGTKNQEEETKTEASKSKQIETT